MPLTDYPQFTSGTYRGRSPLLGTDRCVNMYPELGESGTTKNRLILTNVPGKTVFTTLAQSPGRGIWSGDETRFFCVSGSRWYEVATASGVALQRGDVGTDGLPVQIFSDGVSLLGIVSNDKLYIDAGGVATGSNATEQLTPASAGFTPAGNGVAMGAFVDGYCFVVEKNTNKVYISAIGNMLSWNILDVQIWYGAQDRILQIIPDANHRLWLMGRKTAEALGNVGGSGFPFQRIPGAAMNTGMAAKFGWAYVPTVNGSDQICFLARSDRGGPRVYALDGYRTVRISNSAIEAMIETLPNYGDCVANGYVRGGHSFLHLNFPTNNTGLVYDFSTGWWHERYSGPPSSRVEPVGRFHTCPVNVGSHYWLSGTTGIVYIETQEIYDEAGNAIHWERTGPNANNDEQEMVVGTFRLDCEVGVGTESAGVSLECSYDNGVNFTSPRFRSTGVTGKTTQTVEWHRNGNSSCRSFVPRVRGSDAKRVVIAGAAIDMQPGSGY